MGKSINTLCDVVAIVQSRTLQGAQNKLGILLEIICPTTIASSFDFALKKYYSFQKVIALCCNKQIIVRIIG
jgi:hypothetical protein